MCYKTLISSFVCVLIFFKVEGSVVYRNNAYEELLVAISPDVPQGTRENGQMIINNIKSFITAGSASLHVASKGWVHIKTVKILLPTTWNISAEPVDSYVFEDAEIRVDKINPLYGNSPFTLQTGGCGQPGQYSQVTEEYLTELNTSSTDIYGPPGHVFVHEWSKLRYGVFEEFGYPGDPRYPMFYYKTTWTSSGQENVIKPNFCTNTDIAGNMIDVDGGFCNYDETTGLPDQNCIFQPESGTASSSSIMALQYLEKVKYFCDDTEELYHDIDLPTKQNALCDQRSTWNVVQSHPDFDGFTPRNNTAPTPIFEIIQPSEASFVLVLDVSGSMGTNLGVHRINRMKQAVKRWISYDLKNGTKLGVVTFSTTATEPFPLTPITEANRKDVLGEVEGLNANGGTCMHLGLRKGLEVFRKGGVSSGGVMIFLTDGVARCNGDCNNCNGCSNTDNGDGVTCVIEEIVNQGVRVITIAFGTQAQANIENLAASTNGKAFFVADNTGPEDINNPLSGSLTYQPSVPMGDVEIVLMEKTFEKQSAFSENILIDDFLGKDVNIVLERGFGSSNLSYVTFQYPNGTKDNVPFEPDSIGIFVLNYPFLESGEYVLYANASSPVDFVSLKITSKSKEETLPIYTRCWTSTGNQALDLSSNQKLAILAEVLQGNNPVIGANVIAYIERDGEDVPMEIPLFDIGSNPDLVQNDGIYSRYFTRFNKDERFVLKCQVEGTDDTNINQGFIDARKERALPSKPTPKNPVCCGSNAVNEDSNLAPSGNFSRSAVGGSFSVTGWTNSFNYPPGDITDLSIGELNFDSGIFSLRFTAPGDDLDEGTASSYLIYYSTNKTLLQHNMENNNLPNVTIDFLANNDSSLEPLEAGELVRIEILMDMFEGEVQYYFRILVTDTKAATSVSNIARIVLTTGRQESFDNGLNGGEIFGIVIGTMLVVFLVAGSVFWFKRTDMNYYN